MTGFLKRVGHRDRRWLAALLILAITLFSLPGPAMAGTLGGTIPICTPDGIVQMAVDGGDHSEPHRESALDGHCAFCTGKQFAVLPSPVRALIGFVEPEVRPIAWPTVETHSAASDRAFPQARPRAPPSF